MSRGQSCLTSGTRNQKKSTIRWSFVVLDSLLEQKNVTVHSSDVNHGRPSDVQKGIVPTVALIRKNVSTLVLITSSHNRKAVSQQKDCVTTEEGKTMWKRRKGTLKYLLEIFERVLDLLENMWEDTRSVEDHVWGDRTCWGPCERKQDLLEEERLNIGVHVWERMWKNCVHV